VKRFGLKIDPPIFFLAVMLGLVGVILIASAKAHEPGSFAFGPAAKRQLLHLIVGILCMIIIAQVDYRALCRIAWPSYIVFLLLLIAVLIFGKMIGGSRRWLVLLGFNFQPSEFMKIILILALCDFLHRNLPKIGEGLCLFTAVAAVIPPLFLVILQPDLGTSLCYIPILIGVLLMAEVSGAGILKVVGAGIAFMPVGWLILKDYQRDRLLNFLQPGQDILGPGWQPYQARIAVGSGQLVGEGFFAGQQNMLDFIPGQHTDFIFTVIAEEKGFIGGIILLALFLILLLRGVQTSYRIADPLGRMIIGGVVGWLFFQVFVNVGMTLGIMPVTGLPLPLISYGGSNLIATLLGLGLIMSVHNYAPRPGRLV
jgi:rod shape determining protein RodA